jgi:predicted lactoylglutathione lyase
MATKIFINLPVKDLNKSVEFFTKLDFKFNPQFTNEEATSMIVGEDIFIMLLVEKFFKTFTPKTISDAQKTTEVIISFSTESHAKVDEMIEKVLKAGGKISGETQDIDFMYSRGFEDLDGHLWECAYVDLSAMPPG